MKRQNWTVIIVSAVGTGLISRAALTPGEIRFLLAYPEPTVRQRATGLMGEWNSLQRQNVVNQYVGALRLGGNAERGRKLFESSSCFLCHQAADGFGGISFNVSLAEAGKMGKQRLLTRILNPNAAGQSRYPAYMTQMRNGELVVGFIADQTPKYEMVCDEAGQRTYLSRSNIAGQSNLGFSGMPEGAESKLSIQDMADLLEYLSPQK